MGNTIKRILIVALTTIFAVILILVLSFVVIWHNEIGSVASIKLLVDEDKENKSGPVYLMGIKGGYYFDEFIIEGGVSNDQELIDFIVGNLTKSVIPIKLDAPTIGCSSFTFNDGNGINYFGRNYDFSTTSSIIVRTNPGEGRYASISSFDLQFLGITDGQYLDSIM